MFLSLHWHTTLLLPALLSKCLPAGVGIRSQYGCKSCMSNCGGVAPHWRRIIQKRMLSGEVLDGLRYLSSVSPATMLPPLPLGVRAEGLSVLQSLAASVRPAATEVTLTGVSVRQPVVWGEGGPENGLHWILLRGSLRRACLLQRYCVD